MSTIDETSELEALILSLQCKIISLKNGLKNNHDTYLYHLKVYKFNQFTITLYEKSLIDLEHRLQNLKS